MVSGVENEQLLSFEEATKKYGELWNAQTFRKHLNMSRELVNELIEKDVFKNNVLKVGIDIHPKSDAPNAKYYFPKAWAEKLTRQDVGYSLKEIADILNENYRWLIEKSREGDFDEGRISRYFFNLEWFKTNLPKIHKESYNKRGKHSKSEFYDMLNDNQQKWIEDYLKHRKSGLGIRVGHKIEWGRPPAKPEKTIEEWRKDLSIVFYKIICGRCDIDGYYELERRGKYKDLNEEELKKFDPSVFKVVDFSPSDIDKVRVGYLDTTFRNHYMEKIIKPFLYFILNKKKEKWIEKQQLSLHTHLFDKDKEELSRLHQLYTAFEMSIEMALSKVTTHRVETPEENERKSIFLKHDEVLKAKNKIFNDTSSQEPLKRTLIFMIGCLVGIRPDELAHLKIENFILDENTKLLKRFKFNEAGGTFEELREDDPDYKNGWGRLFIQYNKGGYSKSHPTLGTLIVPRLATFINYYLKNYLYKSNPSAIGKGYLIRPKSKLPDQAYDARGIIQWLTDFSTKHFDFLSQEDRKAFKYYDVRHTVYNLLIKTSVPKVDFVIQERAAQIHARHDIKMKSGNTGRQSYTEEISLKDYYTVINFTLNFPWDLGTNENGEFYEWAIDKGLYQKEKSKPIAPIEAYEVEETEEDISEEFKETLKQLENELQEKEKFAKKLALGPSGKYKDVREWTKVSLEVDNQIKELEKQIKFIKRKGK